MFVHLPAHYAIKSNISLFQREACEAREAPSGVVFA